jgi:hypothetical protein
VLWGEENMKFWMAAEKVLKKVGVLLDLDGLSPEVREQFMKK